MNIHKNAALTPLGREQMVHLILTGRTLKAAAAAFKVSTRTASKWLARFQKGGLAALRDRSSRPKRFRQPTPLLRQEEVIALRRQKLTGFHISQRTGLSRATVSRILRRAHLSRWRDLVPVPAVVRYERAHPGELLHLDIKKLVRIARPSHRVTGNRRDTVKGLGWEYVFVAIDDHSRLAHAAILPDERQASAVTFLRQAVILYARFGVRLQRIMPTTAPVSSLMLLPQPVGSSGSSTSPLVLTRLKPTAKPSASSSPPCASGLMLLPSTPLLIAPTSFPVGFIATTGTAPTPLSASSLPSPGCP